jgi:hypothetical protein
MIPVWSLTRTLSRAQPGPHPQPKDLLKLCTSPERMQIYANNIVFWGRGSGELLDQNQNCIRVLRGINFPKLRYVDNGEPNHYVRMSELSGRQSAPLGFQLFTRFHRQVVALRLAVGRFKTDDLELLLRLIRVSL